jgi:hypothetical protein
MKWKKLVQHLNANGKRAPATVVEISRHGGSVTSGRFSALDLVGLGGLGGAQEQEWEIRKTKLRVRPDGESEFEVETKMRYGGGQIARIPGPGDEFDVLYDPADHENVIVAPPTAEQEALRTAEALSKADIGFTVGGGGKKAGTGKPPTEEQLAQQSEQMDQAQAMLEQAQQFMSGKVKPGETPKSPDEDEEKKK